MMTFANVEDIAGYVNLLSGSGCDVSVADNTGRFPSHIDLYLNMIEMQLTYDVLRTLGFRTDLLQTLSDGFRFLGDLSRAGIDCASAVCSSADLGGLGTNLALGW